MEKSYQKNKLYGITFELFNFDPTTQILFRVQNGAEIYGFLAYDGQSYEIAEQERFKSLADIIKKVDDEFERNERWLGWKYLSEKIDFSTFNTNHTFSLANPQKRKHYVDNLIKEIDGVIQKVKSDYSFQTTL